MIKFILRNLTRYTYRLTDIQGGLHHFGCPSKLAISADHPRGNEIEISVEQFNLNKNDIWKLTGGSQPFASLEIVVRDGNKESVATFDQVWKHIGKGQHPREYRASRRAQVAGDRFPAPMPVAQDPRRAPAQETYEQTSPGEVLGSLPSEPQGIPRTPPAVNPGPPQGQQSPDGGTQP